MNALEYTCLEISDEIMEKVNKTEKRLCSPESLQLTYEPRNEITNNVVCETSKGSDRPVHRHGLIRTFVSRLNVL